MALAAVSIALSKQLVVYGSVPPLASVLFQICTAHREMLIANITNFCASRNVVNKTWILSTAIVRLRYTGLAKVLVDIALRTLEEGAHISLHNYTNVLVLNFFTCCIIWAWQVADRNLLGFLFAPLTHESKHC